MAAYAHSADISSNFTSMLNPLTPMQISARQPIPVAAPNSQRDKYSGIRKVVLNRLMDITPLQQLAGLPDTVKLRDEL